MARTSQKCLESLAATINKKAGITVTEWRSVGGVNIAPVGAYMLDYAYGAVELHRITSEAGAAYVEIPRITKAEMETALRAYLGGMCAMCPNS